jgi:hypothetical protein
MKGGMKGLSLTDGQMFSRPSPIAGGDSDIALHRIVIVPGGAFSCPNQDETPLKERTKCRKG